MKKLVIFLGAVLLLSACGEGHPSPPEATLNVTPTLNELTFSADGSEVFIFTVETNQNDWAVESSQEWCTAIKWGDGIRVTAAENSSTEAGPQAVVTITAGKAAPVTIKFNRLGQEPVPPDPENYILNGGVKRDIIRSGFYDDMVGGRYILLFSVVASTREIYRTGEFLSISIPKELLNRSLNLATDSWEGAYADLNIIYSKGVFTLQNLNRNDAPLGTVTGELQVNKGSAESAFTVELIDVKLYDGTLLTAHFEGEIDKQYSAEPTIGWLISTNAVTVKTTALNPSGYLYTTAWPKSSAASSTTVNIMGETAMSYYEIDLSFFHTDLFLTSGTYTYSTSKALGTFGNTYVTQDYMSDGTIKPGSTITVTVNTDGTATLDLNLTTTNSSLTPITGTVTI